MGQLSRVLKTFRLDDCGRYMNLYPAGALVLMFGMVCILAIPPSGLFISEIMIFRAMVFNGQWIVLSLVIILLCFIIYAMSTRFMHIIFSDPRNETVQEQASGVNPLESISQFVFLTMVAGLCFYQPQFLTDLINGSISVFL
jgi:hydrogenase-4 component F